VNPLEWSEQLPNWQRDALRRIAESEQLSNDDRAAILAQLKLAHGIAIEGDCPCVALGSADLPAETDDSSPTILVGLGPVRHVDQLSPDQELQFALRGITLNIWRHRQRKERICPGWHKALSRAGGG
jgi:hypothetical protein